MSQKSLTAITFCVTVILIIWMLHGSLCEIRMSFWERSLRRSYSVSSKETATGEQSPSIGCQGMVEVAPKFKLRPTSKSGGFNAYLNLKGTLYE
ncbi:Uncharacterised protein [Escherichia coli]|nr:Uncharacterised protein [Escherichia coli]